MKAAVLNAGKLTIEEVAEPRPRSGEIVVKPLACGICGSDLHAKDHAGHLCDLLHRAGFRGFMDPSRPVVMGHEFCAEVLESGAGLKAGDRIVSPPFLNGPEGIVLLGYSNSYPGAFAERMLVSQESCLRVPDDVPTDIAALTEPLAVAVHAVAEGGVDEDTACAVFGCGPVGLFVIARLKALGHGPVLAVEPNPARARMAEAMGADTVVSPGAGTAGAWWDDLGLPQGLSAAMAVDPALRRRSRAVLFECVGKPGMIMALAQQAPVGATIVVVGTCMELDGLEPAFLIQKGLTLRFVFAYSNEEFAAAFRMILDDPERLAPLVTTRVDLAGIDSAFAALAGGSGAIKALVKPAGLLD
ncbi:zinc-binding dehydrogenase [Novosphingobium sp. KCTC 2891]|uniref:zinc-binding dehydrogenase n=1 Tax=Novosphingobium sp. KCTC 2891 TaxID=2989730 RepID=UPI0022213F10|nr:zinc-binding dehydrogenase [Novosphingobium sp. KCTC 2891]MCW1383593.1 zinc-binding dehydrogenase [Novosphingobium sp. KCTC 2891]